MGPSAMTRACPSCGSTSVTVVADYRPSTPTHAAALGCRYLLRCEDCGLGFADPMPALDALQHFYAEVYRRGWLNPYRWNSAHSVPNTPWSDSQLAFIDSTMDLSSVSSVCDIGCGYGHLLRAILERRPQAKAFAYEEDVQSAAYLSRFGVTLNPSQPPTVDLCVSSHTLEHYSAPAPFFASVAAMSPKYLFIEVPNTDGFSSDFLARPYDSPHLLFFAPASLTRLAAMHGWRPVKVDTAGWTIAQTVVQMREHQARLQPGLSVKGALRGARQFAGALRRRMQQSPARAVPTQLEQEWFKYGGPRWSLRGLFERSS